MRWKPHPYLQDSQDGLRFTLHALSACPSCSSCSSCLPLSCISCIPWFDFAKQTHMRPETHKSLRRKMIRLKTLRFSPTQSNPVKASQSAFYQQNIRLAPAQSGSIRLLLSHPRGLRQEENRICRMACVSRSTLDAPRSTLHAPRSTLHAPRSTLHAPRSTLHAPRSTLHAPRSTLHAQRSTPSSCIPFRVFSVFSGPSNPTFYETNPNRKNKARICNGLRNEAV